MPKSDESIISSETMTKIVQHYFETVMYRPETCPQVVTVGRMSDHEDTFVVGHREKPKKRIRRKKSAATTERDPEPWATPRKAEPSTAESKINSMTREVSPSAGD